MIEKGRKTTFSNLCALSVYMNFNKHIYRICFAGEKVEEHRSVTVDRSIVTLYCEQVKAWPFLTSSKRGGLKKQQF